MVTKVLVVMMQVFLLIIMMSINSQADTLFPRESLIDYKEENEGFLVPKKYGTLLERFDDEVHQKTYFFWHSRFKWEMARFMCKSRNWKLAEPTNVEEANFLAHAIAESEHEDFENFWIGGKYNNELGMYELVELNKQLNSKAVEQPDGSFWPPWANYTREEDHEIPPEDFLSPAPHTCRECLSLDRQGHGYANFINFDCNSSLPLICETPMLPRGEVMPIYPKFKSFPFVYQIFRARANFQDALTYCLSHNMVLAVTENIHNVQDIAYYMLRTRPVMTRAWLAGHYNQERQKWEWLNCDHPLLPETPAGKHYPPWYNGCPSISKGALLIERHLMNNTIFLASRETKKTNFVCMEKNLTVRYDWFHIAGDNYISLKKKPFYKMQAQCQILSPNIVEGKDRPMPLQLQSKDDLDKIIKFMAWFKIHVRHLWLPAMFNSTEMKWIWLDGTEFIKENEWLLSKEASNTTRREFACLTLDFENHYHPLIYGIACHHPQYFICKVPERTCAAEKCKIFESPPGTEDCKTTNTQLQEKEILPQTTPIT